MFGFIKYFLTIFLGLVFTACLTGCHEEVVVGPCNPDELSGYFYLPKYVEVFSEGGQYSQTAYGLVGEDGIGVKYMSSRYTANVNDIFNFIGDDPMFDVEKYCHEAGYDTYPNSPDFYVRYKWVEINTVKYAADRDGIITVKADPNPYKEPRKIWVWLQNQKSDVLCISQEGNLNGIDFE